jgi:hypothetical protein|tara:strand:+ start:2083 stop:2418 length:336 start_codon:yes stop_codon:yes gene_type:complete
VCPGHSGGTGGSGSLFSFLLDETDLGHANGPSLRLRIFSRACAEPGKWIASSDYTTAQANVKTTQFKEMKTMNLGHRKEGLELFPAVALGALKPNTYAARFGLPIPERFME